MRGGGTSSHLPGPFLGPHPSAKLLLLFSGKKEMSLGPQFSMMTNTHRDRHLKHYQPTLSRLVKMQKNANPHSQKSKLLSEQSKSNPVCSPIANSLQLELQVSQWGHSRVETDPSEDVQRPFYPLHTVGQHSPSLRYSIKISKRF